MREHPELVRADYCLNEGGGERCVFGGRVFYLCAVGGEDERAVPRAPCAAAAAMRPCRTIADNALVKAAPILEALGRYEPPRELIPEVSAFLELVLGEVPPLEEALARARALAPARRGARRAAALAHALADA